MNHPYLYNTNHRPISRIGANDATHPDTVVFAPGSKFIGFCRVIGWCSIFLECSRLKVASGDRFRVVPPNLQRSHSDILRWLDDLGSLRCRGRHSELNHRWNMLVKDIWQDASSMRQAGVTGCLGTLSCSGNRTVTSNTERARFHRSYVTIRMAFFCFRFIYYSRHNRSLFI